MSADIFMEWLGSQGLRVTQTASSYWVEAGPRVYQAFPYHQVIQPEDAELQHVLRENKALGLRYSAPLRSDEGMVSYHVTYEESDYSLDSLPKKARYDVRKGRRYAIVEPISFTRLSIEGWNLRLETLQRQGRLGRESQTWWRNLCKSAEGLPGFEAWAAIVEGELAA